MAILSWTLGSGLSTVGPITILFWVVDAALGVSLFLRNRLVLFISVCAVAVLSAADAGTIRIETIVYLVSYAAYTAVVFLAFRKIAIAGKIWFVPCVFFFAAGTLVKWIRYGYFNIFRYVLFYVLFDILELAAMLMACLWIKSAFEKDPQQKFAPAPPVYNAPYGAPPVQYAAPVNDTYASEKTAILQDLLNCDVFSRAEFENMKDRIYGAQTPAFRN